ncbi:tetratricopeptide repeat protein [Streptomyces sp. XD-27]|uniref:tetratricopeptide repeat protein n=1 Tax=Streptomyces sp. XD-27 TaxID=3062779 RepID=UPI0026F47CB7|nr:tetratricopeptide repeat protein [Streptomyces sp. XD-27]WKX68957.1 NB-ARC domain-containing protein [Streptomyces sp. XD-27]
MHSDNDAEDAARGGGDGGPADAPQVGNELSGTVTGPVVQAGRTGDISTHHHYYRPPSPLPPSPPDVPHEVPGGTPFWENRDEELAAVSGWLAPDHGGSTRVCVLTGLPGVGKRGMARHWAESVRGRFPGGELYVDVGDLRRLGGGVDLSEVADRLLRSLGVDVDFIPPSLSERVGLLRTKTAQRPPLLVLEGVSEPAHVTTFAFNSPGSAVLATSSEQLAELLLDGARLMPLEPLGPDAGMRLLSTLCGPERMAAEPEAARRIVAACGGLPVALHLAAARLIRGRRLSLSGLADELSDESRRLSGLSHGTDRGIAAMLTVACRGLAPDEARMYRCLGPLPIRTYDAWTAGAAADLEPATAQGLLDGLADASLLDIASDGRYAFHDLVRLHAREQAAVAGEPERDALRRVLTLYVVRTAAADRAIRADRLRITDVDALLQGRDDPFGAAGKDAALDWLATERANAMALLRAADRQARGEQGLDRLVRGEEGPARPTLDEQEQEQEQDRPTRGEQGLDRQIWQLAETLIVLFLHDRILGDWAEAARIGAAAAARDGDAAAEARLRSLLSRPLMDLGEYDAAREELEAAQQLADRSAHLVLRASVQEFLGRYWDRVDRHRAIAAYQHSLELNERAEERRGAAIARYFLGCAQDASGDHATALTTLREAIRGLRGVGDVRMAGRALHAVGDAHVALGETDLAAIALSEAIGMLRQERSTHHEALACESLARLCARADDPAAAREHWSRALEIYEEGGSPRAGRVREALAALEEG